MLLRRFAGCTAVAVLLEFDGILTSFNSFFGRGGKKQNYYYFVKNWDGNAAYNSKRFSKRFQLKFFFWPLHIALGQRAAIFPFLQRLAWRDLAQPEIGAENARECFDFKP